MADLNIRNVDPQLISELKAEAAILGTNLKSYVMATLVGRVRPMGTAQITRAQWPGKLVPGEAGDERKAVIDEAVEYHRIDANSGLRPCAECGALIGHQKWCKGK